MDFIKAFNKKIEEKNINWEVCGLISQSGDVYSLGSDSKLIGRIFELISTNILQEIADENGYRLELSEKQTVYPDFTMVEKNGIGGKIAIDIKTTYRDYNSDGSLKKLGFTLGSYASFIRNGTKNIKYPYKEYDKHYVIGFIYSRNEEASEGELYKCEDIDIINVPYNNVEVFVQEKYKIAGEKPGSGNTENIGSFRTKNMDFFIRGEGPFSALGNIIYEHYWKNYPKYRESKKEYTNIEEYIAWRKSLGEDVDEIEKRYINWKFNHRE